MTIPQAFQIATQLYHEDRFADAEALLRQILATQPSHDAALHLLALIAHHTGNREAALGLLGQAIAANPRVPNYHCDLGAIFMAQGLIDEAIAAYRQALRVDPNFVHASSNLAAALNELRKYDEASAAARHAITLRPGFSYAHYNLGAALSGLGQHGEAATAYRRAIEIDPQDAMAHTDLGNTLKAETRWSEATVAYRRAVELAPTLAIAHSNLGAMLQDCGEIDAALACYQQARRLEPARATHHSNLLIALHYSPRTTLPDLFEAHSAYDRAYTAPLRSSWRPHENSRDPNRPLRIGFISPHFANHPVGRFLIRPLENLDRTEFHTLCYSDTQKADATTARLQAATAEWSEVSALSDEALVQRVHEDRVDILFDLAGHTAGHRLGVFARRPAPIQISWLDYVGTTGIAAIDYLLADPHEIPPAAEPWYRERILRMPQDYICYDPPDDAPPVNPLPALENKHVTFGSFNILAKTTPEIIAVWARILHRLPTARMLLLNRGLDDPDNAARIRRIFAEHGIPADRVELAGWCPPAEVLGRYHRIDIALDTFPYNGGLTTCESLWMGVPVVTSPGETFASRHGLTHLTAAGFPQTIARDLDHYIEIAVTAAADLDRLATARATMRPQIAASPLCDGSRFAAHLTKLLREVWQQWAHSRPEVSGKM